MAGELPALRSLAFKSIEAVQAKLAPAGDWSPMFLTLNDLDEVNVNAVGPLFAEGPERMARALPKLVKGQHAVAASLVFTAWQVIGEGEDRAALQAASERRELHLHPKRQEVLVLQLADRTTYELWTARVFRRAKKPPALGKWEEHAGESQWISGQMAEPWVLALRPQG